MANPYYALRRIRRTRRAESAAPESRFERFRDDYEAILTAVHDLAGGGAVDDLTGWLIVETARDGELPAPSAVRARAREFLAARGVDVPDGSPLAA